MPIRKLVFETNASAILIMLQSHLYIFFNFLNVMSFFKRARHFVMLFIHILPFLYWILSSSVFSLPERSYRLRLHSTLYEYSILR